MQIEGLIPAIVQDVHTGSVLMLAYVNQESYDYMLAKGETCFWSRSRGRLWHKGETSGNVQRIYDMAFDCDRDTLLIQVEQTGAGACHTGSYRCFGDERGEFDIVESIFAQIKDRKANPVPKSYTNYLLDEGLDKVCKKVGEEATEAIIAAKNNDGPALVGEISDLTFHTLVLMFMQGVSPAEIKAELQKRHQVQGNLKDQNTKGAF
ncbi:MAG: bifunctional phosphoribosyl-AMP cyclohydrolase/phosphoribosyl-ATP diphosphatase HisIE [Clostridiales bacterium]|nr:bifunctional phosphoribosyl-AMP cyclohydrolase/phosphoribosyl-ATP diphosphatase HisIE [Clostridiales bacterium]